MRPKFIMTFILLFAISPSIVPNKPAHAYEVFAVGEKGTLFQNDGYGWRRVSGVLGNTSVRFWAFSEDNIYAVTSAGSAYYPGKVFHYDGASWSYFYTADVGVRLTDIWCASETDIFVGGLDYSSEGVMLHYDGVAWTETRYPNSYHFKDVCGSSATDVYAITNYIIIHFDGIGWSEVDLGSWGEENLNWDAIWCNAPNDVYLAGYSIYDVGTCIILHYDGSDWSEVFTHEDIKLTSFWMSDDGVLYASGHNKWSPIQGKVVRYSGSWQIETFPEAIFLNSVHGTSSTDVYVVGEAPTYPDSGIVYHYDGNSWEIVPDLMDKELHSVHSVTEDFVLASGEYGYVFRGSGLDWMRWMPEVTTDFVDVWGTSIGNLYAVSADESIHRYDGISWNEISGPGYPVDKIWGLSANEIYTVGEDGVFRYSGISWSRIFDGPANDIWGTSGTNLYVTNDLTNTYVKHYDGVEWTTVASQFGYDYPPDYSAYDFHLGVWGTQDDELFVVGYAEVCDNPAMMCFEVPTTHHRDESGWEHFLGGTYAIDYRRYDVWGSSSDYVFSVGSQDTRLFDGETQTVIGPGGESVWSSGLEAWWTHNQSNGEGYVAHFDGVQTDEVYLNGCELHGVWGIGEPSSTVMVTVRTDPEGPEFTIDGTTFSAPHSFGSEPGTTYEIGVESPQIGDEGYYFVEWSDGGDTLHTIVVPDTNVTYTAYFLRNMNVTVATEPEGLDVIVEGDIYKSPCNFWMLSGTEVEVGVVSPQWYKGTDYYFLEWSDAGARTHTVTVPSDDVVYTAIFTDVLTEIDGDPLPLANALHQNHPNPFNPVTTICFSLRERGRASLAVYDVAGRLVRVLADGVMEAGPHEVVWDGTDRGGRTVASGVYFYRLETGVYTETRKMVLLR